MQNLGGRDRVAKHEFFGEKLRAFELGGGLLRAKDFEAARSEFVGYAAHQGQLRADDSEIGTQALREVRDCDGVGHIYREAINFARNAAIARGAPNVRDRRALRELPDERMLAAATADNENPHFAATLFAAGLYVNFGLAGARKSSGDTSQLVKMSGAC